MTKKYFILFFIIVLTNSYLYSQIGITNAAPNNNPTYLINNVLIGITIGMEEKEFPEVMDMSSML